VLGLWLLLLGVMVRDSRIELEMRGSCESDFGIGRT
jgi:hypothetical protein